MIAGFRFTQTDCTEEENQPESLIQPDNEGLKMLLYVLYVLFAEQHHDQTFSQQLFDSLIVNQW